MYLPEKFQIEMIRILGEDGFQDYLDSFKRPRVYGLRVNTSKISVADFLKIAPWKLTPIPWISNGFYYDGEHVSPAKHPYYYAGLFYLQEPSAMTPANLLPIEAGDRVLDVCAAPGGKSTELGAKLANANEQAGLPRTEGVLITNDISSSRARGLLKNVELFGIGNACVLCEDPVNISGRFGEFFDKILVDAPCSGEGMFRKEHKMIRAWEEHGPEFFGKLQRSILEEVYKMLRPGGMVLYSTCTFSSHENEGTITWLQERHPDIHVVNAWDYGEGSYEGFAHGMPELIPGASSELTGAIRIWPQRMEGEGHFVCLMRKEETKDSRIVLRGDEGANERGSVNELRGGEGRKELVSGRNARAASVEMSQDGVEKKAASVEMSQDRVEKKAEQIYYMPEELPNLKGCRFLRSGLYLGDEKKGRYEPSQAYAMYLRRDEADRVLDLAWDDPRVTKYLKGETIAAGDVQENVGKMFLPRVESGSDLGRDGRGGSGKGGFTGGNSGRSACVGGGSGRGGTKRGKREKDTTSEMVRWNEIDVGDRMYSGGRKDAGGKSSGFDAGIGASGGETPDCKDWVLVLVDGYPLGWGKLNKDQLKNKYLPGWRMN